MVAKTVKPDSTVSVEYEGRLDDGTLFDTNKEAVAKKDKMYQAMRKYEVLEVKMGQGYVIKGFEKGLLGMKEGEEKDITIAPEEAYGFPRDELMKTIDRELLQGREIKKGDVVMVTMQGQNIPATVTDLAAEKVTLNFNHPLAGLTLHFKLKVIKIAE